MLLPVWDALPVLDLDSLCDSDIDLPHHAAQQAPFKQKQRAQEQAILERLAGMGVDPLMIPKFKHNAPGVKRKALEHLLHHRKDLFLSKKTFDNAWDRLRKNKKIIDAK